MKHASLALSLALAMVLTSAAASAQVVGTVTHTSGVLMSRSTQGVIRVLDVNAPIAQGDFLGTDRNAYAKLRFLDGSEVVLQSDTALQVTRYAFDPSDPAKDRMELNLVQGSLRGDTGEMGRRSPMAVQITTPSGTLQGASNTSQEKQ